MTDRRRAAGLLILAVLLFASAWPAMKLGVAVASPVWFAAARAGLGAAASLALLLALGRLRLPGRADLPIIASIGGLQIAAFFALSHVGLQHLPAGRSVVLAYSTTLWVVPLAWLTLGEAPDRRALAGLGLGLAGLAVLLAPALAALDRPGTFAGHAIMLGAALAWALAILHSRGHRWRLSPFQLLPWQMALAALLLTAAAVVLEPGGGVPLVPQALLPLAYLGALAGPVASWAAQQVARDLPAAVTSLGFLGVPVIGIAAGTLWLGEALDPALLLGGGLLLAGIAIVLAPPGGPGAGGSK